MLVITVTDQSNTTTRTAAWIYLAARTLYIPAYAFGLVPWRSLLWMTGWVATGVMLVTALI